MQFEWIHNNMTFKTDFAYICVKECRQSFVSCSVIKMHAKYILYRALNLIWCTQYHMRALMNSDEIWWKKEKYINQLQDFISRKKQKLKNQKHERSRIKGNKASENEKSKNWIWRHFSRQWSSNIKCLNSEEFANHMVKTKFDNGFEPDSMDFVFVLRAKYSMIIICLWASSNYTNVCMCKRLCVCVFVFIKLLGPFLGICRLDYLRRITYVSRLKCKLFINLDL